MSPLTRLCDELNIRCDARYGAVEVPDGWAPGTHPYKVTLRFGKRQLTVPFFCGPACAREPTAADVLYCLASDARCGEDTFEDFCGNLGYDLDSRKAEATWKTCQAMAPRLRRFLVDEYETVCNAEH
jgi:hypothetical protein